MLMIEPPPWASIAGRKARIMRYMAVTLRLSVSSQSSGSQSRSAPWGTRPAQLKSTSRAPISSAAAATAPASRTSRARQVTPSNVARPASLASSISLAQSRAPSLWNATAVAWPIPCPAAVISAVLPASRPAIAQRPVKVGLRFSTKAATPSAKSSLAAQSANISPSAWSCCSREAWPELPSSRLVLA